MSHEIKSRDPAEQFIKLAEHLAAGDWKLLSFETMINESDRTATVVIKLNALARGDEPEKSEPAGIQPGVLIREIDL